jgi:hypothetical protein
MNEPFLRDFDPYFATYKTGSYYLAPPGGSWAVTHKIL